ncbi:C2H2 zinc finger domain containing protein, putative [Babesia ovis]|uniref:C2H2 zinc finger domain containing protein, putative n=1 Tax=Babesia ovis TaxID=5869 RepID=A0A9W5WTH1_BABOV|nr:C2H2 zinc finger domain containing protein, putative [Babesia ovis]
MLVCADCKLSFKDGSNLRRHQRAVHAVEKPHVCERCGHHFSRSDHLKRHIERHDRIRASLVCGVQGCKKVFGSTETLETHRKLHKEKLESNVIYIKGHLVRKNTEDNGTQLVCPYEVCSKRYASYQGIIKHINQHIREESLIPQGKDTSTEVRPPGETEDTPETINSKVTIGLQTKDITNNETCSGFVCPKEGCGRIFSRRSNASMHVQREHENRQPYKCDSCNKAFKWKKTLLGHICSGANPEPEKDLRSSQHHQQGE